MTVEKFNTDDINDILDDIENNTDIEEDIDNDSYDNLPDLSNNKITLNESEASVDIQSTYKELEGLVKTGNDILRTAKSLIQQTPDGENLSAAASLINSIKDTVKEFSKIYHDKIRYERQKEIELLKIEGRAKHIKLRHELELNNNNSDIIEANVEDNALVEFNQEQIIKMILSEQSKTL